MSPFFEILVFPQTTPTSHSIPFAPSASLHLALPSRSQDPAPSPDISIFRLNSPPNRPKHTTKMCQYTTFHFLCGARKLKITHPCPDAFTNYQGLTYCRLDPQAHVNDGIQRHTTQTYGPGICSNANCRDFHGMAPYDLPASSLLEEDDSPFDMSPSACAERETRWFRHLSTDQQLECLSTTFPVPLEAMSVYAKAFIHFLHLDAAEWAKHFAGAWDASPDEVHWRELNPRYMGPCALQAAVASRLLPAWVVDTGQAVPSPTTRNKSKDQQTCSLARTTTPFMPAYGPFKVGDHTCKPAVGFCGTCGQYHGEQYRGEAVRYHRKEFADFGKLDAETKRVRWEGAWRELTHVRGAMPPFHGNDFERRGLGALGDGVVDGANGGLVSPIGGDEQQQTLMPQDDSTMFQGDFGFNNADMTDPNPNAPSTQAPPSGYHINPSSTTPFNIQQPTFLPSEPLHCDQDFLAIPSVEQFNRTSSPGNFSQAEKYNAANEPSHSGQDEPNTAAGEWTDTMEES